MVKNGYVTEEDLYSADIVIVNTCTVTHSADIKLGQLLRRIRRDNPDAIIVTVGCYPQAHGKTTLISESDITVGESNKMKIPELIGDFIKNKSRISDIPAHKKSDKIETMSLSSRSGKTRAIIKIQDGCDRFCSYCIIPYARGRSRSKPLDEIESEAKALAMSGHKELVLVGVNLSCYGLDFADQKADISDAVKAAALSGAERLRLGSIEPEMLTEEIIKKLSLENKLCPHFHLSLQSGCDNTLRDMRRKYTSAEYRTLVETLRRYFPDCAITTDVMVGFPTETESDFECSLEFVKSIGFSKVHVFPYSEREGTQAAKMTVSVPKVTRFRRAEMMSEAARISENEFLTSHIGKTVEVLFEKETGSEFHSGHTRDYLTVKVPRLCASLWKETRFVEITHCEGEYLYGKIV